MYKCNSCHEILTRVKFQYDNVNDELYIICPNCGGECTDYEEEENEYGELI